MSNNDEDFVADCEGVGDNEKTVDEKIEDICKTVLCDYTEETPKLMHTPECFNECAKSRWCSENLPIIKKQIQSLIEQEVERQINEYHESQKNIKEDKDEQEV